MLFLPVKKFCIDDEAPESFQALEGAFRDYEKFVKDMIPDYPELHPAKTHIRCWRERINFVHCNTAIGADGNRNRISEYGRRCFYTV